MPARLRFTCTSPARLRDAGQGAHLGTPPAPGEAAEACYAHAGHDVSHMFDGVGDAVEWEHEG